MAEKTKKPGFFSRYIGGLLGEDAESMTEDDRRRATLSLLGAIGRNYLSPGSGDESLAAMRASRAAERESAGLARRQAAAEALMPQVVGRLFGGSAGRLESLPGGEGGELSSRYRQDPRDALAKLYGSQAGRDLGQMAPDLAKLATEGTLGSIVGGSVVNRLTGEVTTPAEAKKPKTLINEIRLGDRVIAYFSDGTSQEFKVGMEPGARAAGGGGAGVPGAPPAVKLSADDRKAIREMRGVIQASSDSISGLERALELSPQAYEGVGAAARAAASSALPGSQADAEATIEFDLILKQQVLPQLKTTFGAAPTEGERKILLELQGSASLPRSVRERLLRRAIDVARAKMAANEEDVNSILSGTYYLPPSTPAAATPAAAPPVSAPQADFMFQNGRLVPVKK
jgi:hypothetical protein